MEGDFTVPLLFWPKAAGESLQCVDAHYHGEERTSDLSTFLVSHEQYVYTNGPKLKCRTWHSLFDLRVYIHGESHLCCQKTESASSLPLDFWNQNFLVRRVQTAPFGTFVLCFQIICKTPALVSSNYRVLKVCVAFDRFNKAVSVIKVLFFLFGCQYMRHKSRTEFPFL